MFENDKSVKEVEKMSVMKNDKHPWIALEIMLSSVSLASSRFYKYLTYCNTIHFHF